MVKDFKSFCSACVLGAMLTFVGVEAAQQPAGELDWRRVIAVNAQPDVAQQGQPGVAQQGQPGVAQQGQPGVAQQPIRLRVECLRHPTTGQLKFGMVGGGLTLERAEKFAQGAVVDALRQGENPAAVAVQNRQNQDQALAQQKIDELDAALQILQGNWTGSMFNNLASGLTKREVVYEMLNWPDLNGQVDVSKDARLTEGAKTYLITGQVPNGEDDFKLGNEIKTKERVAIRNIEKAKIFDMKAQRNALEKMFRHLSGANDAMRERLRILNDAIQAAYNLPKNDPQNQNVSYPVRVFRAKIDALNAYADGLNGVLRDLNQATFTRCYEDAYAEEEAAFRQAEDVIMREPGGAMARRLRFPMIRQSRLIQNVADFAANSQRDFIQALRARFLDFAREFGEVINDETMSEQLIVETCKELAQIAYQTVDETAGYTPLNMFCSANIFDLIQRTIGDIKNDRRASNQRVSDLRRVDRWGGAGANVLKQKIYDALPLEAKPGARNYETDEQHRRFVIPEPSEVNGWWDPQMMRNLVIFGTENPTNPRPGVVIRERQSRR